MPSPACPRRPTGSWCSAPHALRYRNRTSFRLGFRRTPGGAERGPIEDAVLDDRELHRSHDRHVLQELERALLWRRPITEYRAFDLAGEVKEDADLLAPRGNHFQCGQDHRFIDRDAECWRLPYYTLCVGTHKRKHKSKR